MTSSVSSAEKITRSMASTIITGPMAACPSSTTSMGTPRKPVLPVTALCDSIAASARGRRRQRATAIASSHSASVPVR